MDAKLNAYGWREVGSCITVHNKSPISGDTDLKAQL